MKKLFSIQNLFKSSLILCFLSFGNIQAQQICAIPPAGCASTDYSNYGFNSNDDSSSIEYDNMVSGYHATIVRNADGTYAVWGQAAGANGTSDVLSPIEINASNFAGLKGDILRFGIGSNWTSNSDVHQFILLTTHGLFAWGTEGRVLHADATSGTSFQRIVGVVSGTGGIIGADTTGLPSGVKPGDVRMLFATYRTLAITTCSGDVYVLSQSGYTRGVGSTSNDATSIESRTWSKVTISTGANPALTDVVACRGTHDALFALDSKGVLWTWGRFIYLGNNTANTNASRATQMTKPVPISGSHIKMIGMNTVVNSTYANIRSSYYVLDSKGNLYAMGINTQRQLGDFTTSERQGWVQCEYTNNTTYMTDIVWVSPNEHDRGLTALTNYCAGVGAVNSSKMIYSWGGNASGTYRMLGLGNNNISDPRIPDGIVSTPSGAPSKRDSILVVETGGHTSMIVKQCEPNFGYVGHRIGGSMGNGSSSNTNENSYTYATAPVQICGVPSKPSVGFKPKIILGGSGNCYETEFVLSSTDTNATFRIISQIPSGIASIDKDTMLIFTAPGRVKVEAKTKTVCGDLLDTAEYKVVRCKFTAPDYNVGLINTSVTGDISINDQIAYSPNPYKIAPTLVSSPSGSSPLINLDSSGTYTFSADLVGSYIYTIPICNPGQVSGCQVEYLTIYLKDLTTLDNPPAAATDIGYLKTNYNSDITLNTLANDQSGNPNTNIDTSSVSIVWGTPNPITQGSLVVNADGSIKFTPVSGFVGDITYGYEVCDNASPAKCAQGIQKIFVLGDSTQNTTLAVTDYFEAAKNKQISGNVKTNDSDPEGNTQTITLQTSTVAGVGVFSVAASGAFTFTPATGFWGIASFTYQTCDNGTPSACANSRIHFMVDNRYTEQDMNATTIRTSVSGNVSTNDNLPAGYEYSLASADPSNPLGASGSVSSDGSYTFSSPNPGLYRFTINACTPSPIQVCIPELITINVSDSRVNSNNPTTNPDMAVMYGHDVNPSTLTINVRANDAISNIFGKVGSLRTLDAPTISVAAKNSQSLTVNGSGNIEYRPNNGFYGNDTFFYNVCDTSTSTCQDAMVVITVNAPSTPGMTVASDDYTYTFSSTPITVSAAKGLLANDFSNASGTWSISPQNVNDPVYGVFTINGDGSYSYTPSPFFDTGTLVIPYQVCKGTACTEATLYIQVFDLTLLPVELIKFTPVPYEKQVDVLWTTAGELNNDFFTIERSYNKQEWIFVGNMKGAGTSYTENNYSLIDYTTPEPLVYYKISQTDYDGNRKDLRIAKLQKDLALAGGVLIFPNPCYNELNLSGLQTSNLSYEIYNSFGQVVLSSNGGMGEDVKIDVSSLAQGSYFIRIYDKGTIKVKAAFVKLD